jgi:hypothetical protein
MAKRSKGKSGRAPADATGRAATRAFKRAWKLLGRLERELDRARKDEAKRRRQLESATGDEVVRRQAQLDEAIARGDQAAALLTELSELIAANARARGGQTVRDMAHEAAEAVRSEEQARPPASSRRTATPRVRRAATSQPKVSQPKVSQPTASRPRVSRPATPRAKPAVAGAEPAPGAAEPGLVAAQPAPVPAKKVRSPRGAAATKPVPRARRSLQPGTPDPDHSSG